VHLAARQREVGSPANKEFPDGHCKLVKPTQKLLHPVWVWNPATLGRFWHSKRPAQLAKVHCEPEMGAFRAMLTQVSGQVWVLGAGGGGGGGDGDGLPLPLPLPLPMLLPMLKILASEGATKRLKKDKARRKAIKLEVFFMVDLSVNETVSKSKQESMTASVSDDNQIQYRYKQSI
jgi:hypothetical protein